VVEQVETARKGGRSADSDRNPNPSVKNASIQQVVVVDDLSTAVRMAYMLDWWLSATPPMHHTSSAVSLSDQRLSSETSVAVRICRLSGKSRWCRVVQSVRVEL
jgi:hypothetical protein